MNLQSTKKLLYYFLLLGCILNSCVAKKEPMVLRFGHQANEGDIWHKASLHFKDLVEKMSEGQIEVRVYAAEQLGNERDMIRSIKAGIVDMTTTGESMQNWSEITAFCAMPYLIKNSDHLQKVVNGPIGQQISGNMIRDIGLRPLFYFERGARNLTSNRAIISPDDLNGLIVRVPNVPIFVQTWTALGAKPTPMTFSEVFTALQQGTVEAQENPYALINSAGFYEVQKFVNLTEHVIGWVYVVIGEKKFQSLPKTLQDIVIKAGKLTQQYHQELFQAEEKYLKNELVQKGMVMQEVDKKAFQMKASNAIKESLSKDLLEVYEQIEKLN